MREAKNIGSHRPVSTPQNWLKFVFCTYLDKVIALRHQIKEIGGNFLLWGVMA
jgi:hypothetical protein